MSIKKLFLAAVMLGIITLLSACEAEPAGAPTLNPPTAPATTAITSQMQPATVSVNVVTEQQTVETVTEADKAAYQAAMRLNDIKYCDQIKDENYKKLCQDDFNNLLILGDALSKLDAAICEKISTTDKRQSCKTQVEMLTKEKETDKKNREETAKNQDLMDTLTASGEYGRCTELQNQNSVRDCEYNILVNKAIQEKEISWCDKASLAEVKVLCREDAAKALK
jgi:hypothetical protein